LTTLFVQVHDNSYRLFTYYRKKGDYSYRSAPLREVDYEKEILLEEDEDDDAFDYEANRLPNLLTEADLIKMKTINKPTELSELKNNK
jgi:hypothetical protein